MNYVFTHVRPDADAIASAIGLATIMTRSGQPTTALLDESSYTANDGFPALIRACALSENMSRGHFNWWRMSCPDHAPRDFAPANDQLIVVDCGDRNRISAPQWALDRGFDHSFDHHLNNWVAKVEEGWQGAAAAAQVVFEWAVVTGQQVDADTTEMLLAGVLGDTCGLTVGVDADILESVTRMIRAGADYGKLMRVLRTETAARKKLRAEMFSSLQVIPFYNGLCVAVTALTPESFARAGATRADYAGMPSELLAVEGVDVGIALNWDEKAYLWRMAIRTDHVHSAFGDLTAQSLARLFGGDGHPDAAGGRLAPDVPVAPRVRGVLDGLGTDPRNAQAMVKAALGWIFQPGSGANLLWRGELQD